MLSDYNMPEWAHLEGLQRYKAELSAVLPHTRRCGHGVIVDDENLATAVEVGLSPHSLLGKDTYCVRYSQGFLCPKCGQAEPFTLILTRYIKTHKLYDRTGLIHLQGMADEL